MKNQVSSDIKERFYVYANYLSPGKHNACILYNTKNIPNKNLTSLIVTVLPRKHTLDISKIFLLIQLYS